MVFLRTTARGFLCVVLLGLLAGSAVAKPDPPARYRQLNTAKPTGRQIVYPVLGFSQLTYSFGDPRGQGAHQGEDMMADRWTPVLAVEAGRVKIQRTSGRAGCMLYLYGKSGTKYLYIHLNNDLTRSNDNRGRCVPGTAYWKGLRDGMQVEAGQPLGFVGNSGDAEGGSPHLHFEVHPGGGAAVDPVPYLRTAKRLLFYAPTGTIVSLVVTGKVLAVRDEALRVRIGILRGSPMGVTLRRLERPVTLSVPLTATVERGGRLGAPSSPVQLLSAKPGETVNVWTLAAPVTADLLVGKAGAIEAERVLLPPPA
ncbi:MAG TPA: M23 family metallopeptidase [Gaiellaceae bacterium]|nr:M23 family metallopeptidase [Gaiellaceae bacterium]